MCKLTAGGLQSSKESVIETLGNTKCILVAPLNWGLGHATRCIPIINDLIKAGKQVVLASDGPALALLKEEFPKLKAISLPSYGIVYAHRSMVKNMLLQTPRILSAIRKEKQVTNSIVKENNIDTIISDNRYGVRSRKTKNIIICHQIQLQEKNQFVSRVGSFINRHWINKFDECWIPDYADSNSLAGNLSNAEGLKKARYIGTLSRMTKRVEPISRGFLVVLSGPEPARTRLENKIRDAIVGEDYLLVRGLIENSENTEPCVVSYLTSSALEKEILRSEWIICRSGYTSIMDLRALGKKAILIPTPGQSEQEYLANHVADNFPEQFRVLEESDIGTGVFQSFTSKYT